MHFLDCGHQLYEWGTPSDKSLIFQIQSSNPHIQPSLNPNEKFAELWIGTHINLPSFLNKSPEAFSLLDFLKKYPEYLGEMQGKCDGELPFLMKVLSVGKSLSIQAHPDKELAEILHKKLPNIYKDANHKPEMAIAITKFEVFCNFAQKKKIEENLRNYDEFRAVFSQETLKDFENCSQNEGLKALVLGLFKATDSFIHENLDKLVKRIRNKKSLEDRDEVILRLNEQYPFDIGIFFTLLMNYDVLSPGQYLIMRPNEPHAYLSGECIECMANSDNVVRAGLTPKLKDIETLCKMMSFKMDDPEILNPLAMRTKEKDGYDCFMYKTEFREFHCIGVDIESMRETELFYSPFPFVGIVIQGEGSFLSEEGIVEINEFQQFFVRAKLKFSFVSKRKLKVYLCGSW